jgi:L-rhamnose-H+ transport protein
MSDTSVGLLLCLVAGATSGSFAVPMKFARGWAWENIWFVWTALALIAMPVAATMITIPRIGEVYAEIGPALVMTVAFFGLGWGVAQVLFGLAVEAVGMALAFSIAVGMSAALGSAVPLLGLHGDGILSTRSIGTLFGIALIVVAMTISALAGRLRELARSVAGNRGDALRRHGLTLAIASGLGSAMINFALAFGSPLLESARRHGADPLWAANGIWLPMMVAGAVPNLAYCAYLMRRNRTGSHFTAARTRMNWLHAAIMAGFWFGSISLYALAIGKLGNWGTAVGWPLFTSLIVITAGALGIAAGEWRQASAISLKLHLFGMSMLIAAVCVLSATAAIVPP